MTLKLPNTAALVIVLVSYSGWGAPIKADNRGWGEIQWGEATNGVCLGLQVQPEKTVGSGRKTIEVGIFVKSATNTLLVLVVPPDPTQLSFWLTNDLDQPVPLTVRGRELGREPPPTRKIKPTESSYLKRIYLKPNDVTLQRGVDLFDYFEISRPGKHHLVAELKLQSLSGNWVLDSLPVLRAACELDIRK